MKIVCFGLMEGISIINNLIIANVISVNLSSFNF